MWSGHGDRKLAELPDELCARVHGLFIFRRFLTEEDIERFPKLRVVVRMGVGFDCLDRKALAARGVKVRRIHHYGTGEVADHAIALALAMRRGIMMYHSYWLPATPAGPPRIPPWEQQQTAMTLRPSVRTLGILGLGRIGTATVLRAKPFGWRIIFYDPYLPNGVDRALSIERVRTIEELFQQSDTLSVHVPLTSETAKFVNERLLRMMPQNAVLVNTSRGGVVDLDGLEKVLKDDHLAGAGLDVVPVEPPVPNTLHPLLEAYRRQDEWIRGRLVVTPHVAFASPDSLVDIREKSAWCMREVLCEGKDTNVIPPDALWA
ncbi:4-phosphoerythronate dehydrogenase [Fistulina hepatica ATCC 64428]|uniref:4-phosphoerythronate dehydrogenase n=1 Tax=Fistulina hepatica ATCC 64428 TaxID=1128425 RepID=A0A0D7ALJ7_9AGAR|nr:4-phosphoerythronate dehydrogenase [Fistulina hepatica ATCC 64428]